MFIKTSDEYDIKESRTPSYDPLSGKKTLGVKTYGSDHGVRDTVSRLIVYGTPIGSVVPSST